MDRMVVAAGLEEFWKVVDCGGQTARSAKKSRPHWMSRIWSNARNRVIKGLGRQMQKIYMRSQMFHSACEISHKFSHIAYMRGSIKSIRLQSPCVCWFAGRTSLSRWRWTRSWWPTDLPKSVLARLRCERRSRYICSLSKEKVACFMPYSILSPELEILNWFP